MLPLRVQIFVFVFFDFFNVCYETHILLIILVDIYLIFSKEVKNFIFTLEVIYAVLYSEKLKNDLISKKIVSIIPYVLPPK